jgi:hypothetical protein
VSIESNVALRLALDLQRQPNKLKSLGSRKLPAGMLTLIKIAAGDEPSTTAAVTFYNSSETEIQSAAKFMLQQTALQAGNDPWRILCLNVGASAGDIKDHKRWLLKWLHPDRNNSKWEAALFFKVKEAFDRLPTTAEPAEIDASASPRAVPAANDQSLHFTPKTGHAVHVRGTKRSRHGATSSAWKSVAGRRPKINKLLFASRLMKAALLVLGLSIMSYWTVTFLLSQRTP